MSKEEFLENRRKGIGGSDIAAILGMDKYKTPFKVWYDKVFGSPRFENKYTKAGIYLEDSVCQMFLNEFDEAVCESPETKVHPKYDFILGNIDRIIDFGKEKAVLEIKTTQEFIEEIPQYWYLQLNWYMNICGIDRGYIAWLERGLDFHYREFERNEEIFNDCLSEAVTFWNDYVITKVPPPYTNGEDVETMHPVHKQGDFITGRDEVYEAYNRLIQIKEMEKELTVEKAELQDQLKMVIQGKEGIKYGDKVLITWKANKKGSRVFSLK